MDRHGKPEIYNSDQGCQFTSQRLDEADFFWFVGALTRSNCLVADWISSAKYNRKAKFR